MSVSRIQPGISRGASTLLAARRSIADEQQLKDAREGERAYLRR